MPDSTQKIMRSIRKLGWTPQITNGGHIRCTHPDGKFPVITGASPSDRRERVKFLKQLQKSLNTADTQSRT